jgi:nucleoside-diphosphate-sugar epimerase
VKYFVTGATGFLGGRVARLLRAAGHDVVALVRDPSQAVALASEGVELARGDVTDRASLRVPMASADRVFHIAGWYKLGARDRALGQAVNVEGTRNVLEMMRELGVERGVYTSTLAVNSDTHGRVVDETYRFKGKHLSEYDRTKAAAHDVARELADAGLPLIIVQPGVIYGPGDRGPTHDLFVQFLQRKLPMVPRGTTFCWAHLDDVAAGHLLAMEHGRVGESYFLAGPACSVEEVLTLAGRVTGVPVPRLRAAPWVLKSASGVMRVLERIVPVPQPMSGEALRESAGTTYVGDASKASRELGWRPRSLVEGLPGALRDEASALGMPLPA